jgi:hypothetical protein
MTELTAQQLAIIEQMRSARPSVPTQRARVAAQGLSFGVADEIEARARSLMEGRPYDQVLAEIRGAISAYQEDQPMAALGYEIGGSAIPGLLAAPFTGGTSMAPTLGRMALIGGAQGAGYAFGTGEGSAAERLARVPGGAAAGAVGGAVAGAAVRAGSGALNVLTDSARRLVGRRGSSVVENEIQRLVEQTGKTADEIADDIINGRILAENATISAAVRALRSQGGEASTILQETLTRRPAQTREQAMQEMRTYLSDAGESSALQAQRRGEEAARAAERSAYSQFDNMPAPDEVVEALGDTLRRVPAASREVEEALRASTGQRPFYSIAEDGTVTFTRPPTVAEAERVRRAVDNRASTLYREGQGGAGEAVAGAGRELRDVLDMSVPELATARGQAAAVRANRDAFETGQRSLAGDVNERLLEFSRLTDPQAIQSYRAGLMAALEARAATGSRQSMIRNLVDETTKEGMILRAVFPQDQLDGAINALSRAAESQAASSRILGGSPTAETLMEAGRQGAGVSASDVMEVLSGNPMAVARVAFNLVRPATRNLNDAERTRIAQILVSEDPDLVRRALMDESAMAALQQRIAQITMAATRGAAGAGGTAAAMPAANLSEGVGRGILQMQ